MSIIDGRKVGYRNLEGWEGIVQGDSPIAGNVRVQWRKPHVHTGAHAITDLVVLDKASDNMTEEEIAMFRPR